MGIEASGHQPPATAIEKPARPEREELGTPNLRKLKTLVTQLHQAKIITPEDEARSRKELRWGGADSVKVLNITFPVNYEANSAARQELVGQTYDSKSKDSEIKSDQPLEVQIQKAIEEYKDLLAYQKSLLSRVPKVGGDIEKTEGLLTRIAEPYRMVALHKIIALGMQFFGEDALTSSGLPLPEVSMSGERDNLAESLKGLAQVSADPALKNEYSTLLQPLYSEESSIELKNPSRQSRYQMAHSHGLSQLEAGQHGQDFANAIGDFQRSFRKEEWRRLNATPDETKRLYDIIQGSFFRTLYYGGRESWDGTAVSGIFYELKDARALPGLIAHLQMSGSGHTNAGVVSTVREIAKHPVSSEDLQVVLDSTTGITKRILEEWIINPDEGLQPIVESIEGYTMAAVIQNPEKHFGYGKLVALAESIRLSKSLPPFDADILSSYFLGNFAEYTHTDQVDNILIENIKQASPLIVEAKMTELRDSNQKLFNALVNPTDRNYTANYLMHW